MPYRHFFILIYRHCLSDTIPYWYAEWPMQATALANGKTYTHKKSFTVIRGEILLIDRCDNEI